LQSYTGPKEELGTAERFLFELLCIPRLKPRLQCFVFILEFNARLHDLSENVEVFSYAIHDIKRCKKLVKVIELVLAIGNYLNGTGTLFMA
jgi:diaphanous 1